MRASRLFLPLMALTSFVPLVYGDDPCNLHTWDAGALHGYCTTVGQVAYRSPACSVFRLCNNRSATGPALGAQLCSLDRLHLTLCADLPNLPECQQFLRHLPPTESISSCATRQALQLPNTPGLDRLLTAVCKTPYGSGGANATAVRPGCERCGVDGCETPDALLAYTAACAAAGIRPPACDPWATFCALETSAAASRLCLQPHPLTTTTTTTSSSRSAAGGVSLGWRVGGGASLTAGDASGPAPPPPLDPCIADPSQPDCVSYTYPDSAARTDIDRLCDSMPDMPGCAISRACDKGEGGVAPHYCRPFVLLATLCADMPGMRGCESYKALCLKPGSVVAQCSEQRAIPGAPKWSQARKAVFSACEDHPMAACASCSRTECPDPLGALAGICHEMPDMSVCGVFWGFCQAAGKEEVGEWCAEDDSKYLPSMLMYFHQRTQELVLWKEWRPRTQGQYALSVVAIVAMGVVATGLKTFKGALLLHWGHSRLMAATEGRPPRVGDNVWAPRPGQLREILVKAGITGVSLTLDYFNMLIAMTFNVGLFVAVIAGYIIGSLVFSHVLENYGALLHQQRRDLSVAVGKRRVVVAVNGGSVAVGGGAAGSAGKGGVGASRGGETSEGSEVEEDLLLQAEGEGECNCVHSA